MTAPVGPIVALGLNVVKLLGRIKVRDPKLRARTMRARARNHREEAERLITEIRRHQLNVNNGGNEKFHRRKIRRLERRRDRLLRKALWWDNQAERLDPQ